MYIVCIAGRQRLYRARIRWFGVRHTLASGGLSDTIGSDFSLSGLSVFLHYLWTQKREDVGGLGMISGDLIRRQM